MQRLSEITQRMLAEREPQVGHRTALALAATVIDDRDPMHGAVKEWAAASTDLARDEIVAFIEKADVPAGQTGDLTTDAVRNDYLALEAPFSAFAQIGGRPVPIGVRMILADSPLVGHVVGEGIAIPMSGSYGEVAPLPILKSCALTAITAEFGRLLDTNGRGIASDLASATAAAKDGAFLGVLAAAASGSDAISTTGSSLAQTDADLKAVIARGIVNGHDLRQDWLVMSPTTFSFLASLRGSGGNLAHPGLELDVPRLFGVRVSQTLGAVTAGSPPNIIALVDPRRILVWQGPVDFSVSQNASLLMDDTNPNTDMDSVTPDHTASLVSMFQTNTLALRAQSWFSFRAAPGAAVKLLVAY